jgi:predicted aspartyl protease
VLRTILDTGSTVTSLDIDHAKRRFGIGPGSPGVERAGITRLPSGKTVDLYSYTFKTLTISGIRFENVTVHLGKFDETDLILGMN